MYKLYVVNYTTDLREAKYHQALFIETQGPGLGVIYEVHGPFLTTGDYQKFVFNPLVGKAPEHSSRFVSWEEIGSIREEHLEDVSDVCMEVPPPTVPKVYNGESPNCCDWLNTVIFELGKRNLAIFNDSYTPPSDEVNIKLASPDRDGILAYV